jgi:hypothetical protein
MFGEEEWRKPILHFTEAVASFDFVQQFSRMKF